MKTIQGYKLTHKLSEGTHVTVWRGVRERDNTNIVVKTNSSEYPSKKEVNRLNHEYEILNKLKITGVAKVLDRVQDTKNIALILEDIQGETLKYIHINPMGMSEFLLYAIQLSSILGDIHSKGIMHKDINPKNIVINPETKEVKIIDFGLATYLPKEEQKDVAPLALQGTLAYMSPEQTGRMNRAIDYRTDFYSLGVTFYEMLTGELPFQSTDPMELLYCHIARTPVSPVEKNKDIPSVLSKIVMKLLSKNAEDRYQSAYGLKNDLEACLEQLRARGTIGDFPLCRDDVSERFQIPQKLYGREEEIARLLKGFEHASGGAFELMLVSGYSGVGKSSLVHEVHKPIVQKKGYFISGKYDQYKRNIPYSAIVQAFHGLIQQLLMEAEDQLVRWKEALLNALGTNGQVMVDIIPELERIIGKQPPVLQLGPQETQNRFNMVLKGFVNVFARKDHPLVMFLDDLQWSDLSSLKLIKLLSTDLDMKYFLMVGAYRDNEVDVAHPLMMTVEEVEKAGGSINRIEALPLQHHHINHLIADTLHSDQNETGQLTELVMKKTGGNPFFVNQFLKSLYEESLLLFDADARKWKWDVEKIRKRDITDNVVELMVGKLRKLPEETQQTLRLAACIGNQFDMKTLSHVREDDGENLSPVLWQSIKEGLIAPLDDYYYQGLGIRDRRLGIRSQGNQKSIPQPPTSSPQPQIPESQSLTPNPRFRFLHDRVQQAAYSLIPEDQKKKVHLSIGRLLLKNTSGEEREEKLFDIVNHLNMGTELIIDEKEKEELAALNLRAGRKAKESTAYNDSLKYLSSGIGLLSEDKWQKQYGLTLQLIEEGADVSYLCGEYQTMEALIAEVLNNAKITLDKVNAYRTRIHAFIAQNKPIEAVNTSIEILNQLGVAIPQKPKKIHLLFAKYKTKWVMGIRSVDSLKDLPQMKDPEKIAALQIMADTFTSAYYAAPVVLFIMVCNAVLLSIKYGNDRNSAIGYVLYGILLCSEINKIDVGYQFGKLAISVRDKLNAKDISSKVLCLFHLCVFIWKFHLSETLPSFLEGYKAGRETGDLEFCSINLSAYCFHSIYCGRELSLSSKEAEQYHNIIEKIGQKRSLFVLKKHHQTMLNLIGKGSGKSILKGEVYDEEQMIPFYSGVNDCTSLGGMYVYKIMLAFLFCEYQKAIHYASEIEKYYFAIAGEIMVPIYHFYHSLVLIALYAEKPNEGKKEYIKQVKANQKKLRKWAYYAPMNHQHKYYLVEAELARVQGRDVRAMEMYDKAIEGARKNEYVNEEALSNEVAGRYYLSKGKERIAHAYMKEALYCYYRWGAHAKVKDLRERYPQLLTGESREQQLPWTVSPLTTTSSDTASLLLDLTTLMNTSQTITGEIVLSNLIERFMKLIMENIGAQRGMLVVERGENLVTEAEGKTEGEGIVVTMQPKREDAGYCEPIVNYSGRMQEVVALDDAMNEGMFTDDRYVKDTQQRSVLCMPVHHLGRQMGFLYFENTTTKGVFNRERVEFLKLLSGQIAISLENAYLYDTLEQRIMEKTEELRRSQEQLIEREKMASLGRLVAGVAHEINTPVGIGVTAASTLERRTRELEKLYKEDSLTNKEIGEFIDISKQGTQMIVRNLERAANQIRSFKQVAVDQSAETKRPFHLKEYINDILLGLHPRLRHAGITAKVDCPDDLIVESYPGVYSQILSNLVMNSLTHGFKGKGEGTITIRCIRDESQLLITYTDDGVGIGKEIQNRIFEPFFTTSRAEGGSGLGLNIVYNLVTQKLGGTVQYKDTGQKGACFELCLLIH